MNIHTDSTRKFCFIAILAFCVIIGAFLRLYLLADQVLLDDEWHGLFYATGHNLLHLLRYTTADATCAPLNFYAGVLLHTLGWSETALRLPSLFFGLLALMVFPLLVRRVHGDTVACIFTVFLSVSPFLVLYSRIFRPYSALIFFEFVAIYSAGIWLVTGEKKFRWAYMGSAIAALYFHPLAAIGVFSPFFVAGILNVIREKVPTNFNIPDFIPHGRSMLITVAVVFLAFFLTVQPTVIAENVGPGSPLIILTWVALLMMFFGTSGEILACVIFLICMSGIWTLFKNSVFWGTLFIVLFVLHILMIFICGFAGIDVPVVLARYMAILFPIFHVGTAIALKHIYTGISGYATFRGHIARALAMSFGGLIFLSLLITNPLWHVYASPNNFTNHPAFFLEGQPHLDIITSDFGPPRLSPFYRSMPTGTKRIIEYPMMLGDHYNLYYYYQHYHGKQIVIGYTNILKDMPIHRDGVSAEFLINHIIHAVDDKRAIRFRTMVNILDAESVKRSRADFLICHKNMYKEFLPGENHALSDTSVPGLKDCIDYSQHHFGPPVFEDENIVVFGLMNAANAAG